MFLKSPTRANNSKNALRDPSLPPATRNPIRISLTLTGSQAAAKPREEGSATGCSEGFRVLLATSNRQHTVLKQTQSTVMTRVLEPSTIRTYCLLKFAVQFSMTRNPH